MIVAYISQDVPYSRPDRSLFMRCPEHNHPRNLQLLRKRRSRERRDTLYAVSLDQSGVKIRPLIDKLLRRIMTPLYVNFSKRLSGIAAMMAGNEGVHSESKVDDKMLLEGDQHIQTSA